jgi:hypothetical protein
MTRVTDHYHLGATQGGVDFVDVDIDGDVPVYIDPTAIRNESGDWADACVESLQSFFSALLAAVKADDREMLGKLIYPLREPNETHLGDSKGKSQGTGLGSAKKAAELIQSLRGSRAVQSGFLTDLEDSALMVEGIDKDIVSDITTCVIRRQLIAYTQQQCDFYEIVTESQESGPMWDVAKNEWVTSQVELPRAGGDKLLLVPKSIVRVRLTVDKGRYYRGYLRPYFEDEVLANPTAGLVRTLKSGEIRVRKTKLDGVLGTTKPDIVRNSQKHPQALMDYKSNLHSEDEGPLTDESLAEKVGADVESLRDVLDEIRAVAPGRPGATPYHRAVAKLLTGLFSLSLGNGRIETPIHNDMKRIDITYDNVAKGGFFNWVALHYPAATVVVECKNYGKDVANPEFDQIAMRFSPNRGRIGILACRSFADKERALARARAISADQNGYVIVLDDDDFERLVDDYEAAGTVTSERTRHPLLRERFEALLSG